VAATDVHALIAELQEWSRARGAVTQTHIYGPAPEHEADLMLPAGDGPHRVAVLLHGGFWRAPFKRSIMDALAIDLAQRGWASWNIEYRRGGSGGGASETTDDVRAAIGARTTISTIVGVRRFTWWTVATSSSSSLAKSARSLSSRAGCDEGSSAWTSGKRATTCG